RDGMGAGGPVPDDPRQPGPRRGRLAPGRQKPFQRAPRLPPPQPIQRTRIVVHVAQRGLDSANLLARHGLSPMSGCAIVATERGNAVTPTALTAKVSEYRSA